MQRFVIAILVFTLCLAAYGQEDVQVQVATEEPPHYAGVGMIVQLTVEGLEANPQPKCVISDLPAQVRANLLTMTPQVMQQMYQQGGKIIRVKRVIHKIQFRVTADEPGDYEIGPFKITQGNVEKQVDAIRLSFQAVPETEDVKVKLILPESAYPDQRVPVKVEWWFAGDPENLSKLSIRSTLFDQFRFAPDKQLQRGDSSMPIQTAQGELDLAATVRREEDGERTFTVLSAERTMVPDRPGRFKINPIVSTVELVTEWERRQSNSIFDDSFFGGSGSLRPAKVEMFKATGDPINFEVKPFPAANKPASFTGTVGKGFSLDVAADRTVVRVGDPIRLTIRLRGDGNVQGASLPPLSSDGGLNPSKFRLPESDIAGAIQKDGSKEFTVSIRVKDESINEIPAIAYSWFDAENEQYRTARSDPIALRVDTAVRVGADSVVSNQPAISSSNSPADRTSQSTSSPARTFSLTGADLAIEPDPAKLLGVRSGLLGSTSVQAASYLLGAFLLLVALFDYRRRLVDPEQLRQTELVRQQSRRIQKAHDLAGKEAAREIAEALRQTLAEFPNADQTDQSQVRSIMSRCESITYQPDGSGEAKVDSDLVQDALQAVKQLAERVSV